MPVDISGLTGIESPGYSQGGAPVVESGSNSDGSWTRWADGTLLMRLNPSLSSSGPVTNTLPVPAASSDYAAVGTIESSNDTLYAAKHSNKTATTVNLSFVNPSGGYVLVSGTSWAVIGRWK